MHLCGVHYSGEFTIGEETYSVEPVEETLSGVHRVYRESDSVLETHICGICSLYQATHKMDLSGCDGNNNNNNNNNTKFI